MTMRSLTNRLLAALRLRKSPEPELDDSDWPIPVVWEGKSEHELELEETS
jgi:hypothetical protein